MGDFSPSISREEYEEMLKSIRGEVAEEKLDAVVGGDSNQEGEGLQWKCPFCGQQFTIYKFEDGAKHAFNCPANPYK